MGRRKRMAKAKRAKYTITGGDRISNLPQTMIHLIMSLLHPIDMIRTCTLSKNLQSALKSFPIVELDRAWFNTDPSWPDVRGEFVNYVNTRMQSLKLDKAPLKKLRLRAEIKDRKQAAEIKKAVKCAIRNCVEELDIDLVRPRYSLPLTTIRSASSLVNIHLAGLKLSNFNGLDMSYCWPLVETICVSRCTGLKIFQISSPKTRSIVLKDCRGLIGVKIQSRSLLNFEFSSTYECDIDISECQFLKMLTLEGVRVKDSWIEDNIPNFLYLEDLKLYWMPFVYASIVVSSESLKKLVWLGIDGPVEIRASNLQYLRVHGWFNDSISFRPCFPQLEHLSFFRGLGFTTDYLKEKLSIMDGFGRLELVYNYQFKLIKFEISRHKRSSSDSVGDVDELVEVKLRIPGRRSYDVSHLGSLLNASIINSKAQLLDVTLLIDSKTPLDNHCLITLWNWIASFGRVNFLTLGSSPLQELRFPESTNTFLLSPMYDLEYLAVKLLTRVGISPEFIGSFLWQSPNLETLGFFSTEGDKRSIEFEYGSRTVTEDDLICCKHLSMKCWRHSLTKVLLTNFDDGERDKLVKYLSENARLVNEVLWYCA